MTVAGEHYTHLFTLMAKQSPLDALRQLELYPDQLKHLAVICRAISHTDFADLVEAEADLRTMLERWNRRAKCLK